MKSNKMKFRDFFKRSKIIKNTSLKKTRPSIIVFFKPDNYLKSLASISVDSLTQLGFKWVIINTNIKNPMSQRIKQLKIWIDKARGNGLKILILSNRPKRYLERNLKQLDLNYDVFLSNALKPFVFRRKKLLKIVGDLEEVFMICNDFLYDVPTANILRIENSIIENNFLHDRLIDKKISNYQKRIVTYFLRRNNMLNELESFQVDADISNNFL